MNIDLLYHPDHSEEVEVNINDDTYTDQTYSEWCELMKKVENGDVSYATWYQEEETDNEVMVLCHDYVIKNGIIVSYDQELTL